MLSIKMASHTVVTYNLAIPSILNPTNLRNFLHDRECKSLIFLLTTVSLVESVAIQAELLVDEAIAISLSYATPVEYRVPWRVGAKLTCHLAQCMVACCGRAPVVGSTGDTDALAGLCCDRMKWSNLEGRFRGKMLAYC